MVLHIDRELNPGGGDESREAPNSKQQAGSFRAGRAASCGSTLALRLPHDARADGFVRQVELDRMRVVPCAVCPWPLSLPSASFLA